LLRRSGVYATRHARTANIGTLINHVIFVFFIVVVLFFLTNHASTRFWTAAWLWTLYRHRSVVVVVGVIWPKTQVIHCSSKH
jgi:hypothetical protein